MKFDMEKGTNGLNEDNTFQISASIWVFKDTAIDFLKTF